METLLGLIIGVLLSSIGYMYVKSKRNKSLTTNQSVILLDKIKSVLKLITVEGEFAEIYHHENTKEQFLGLLSSRKKAIILINAKVHVGFDFQKIKLSSDLKRKTITVHQFPKPEVLSIEPNLRFYDIKNGIFNKFRSEDLTTLNIEVKNHIIQKIPDSSLMKTANREALEAINLIKGLVEPLGWTLDYSVIELPEQTQKQQPLPQANK